MLNIIKRILLATLMLAGYTGYATTFTAVRSGKWNDAGIWNGKVSKEINGEMIYIPAGITVDLDGNVSFVNGSKLQLDGNLVTSENSLSFCGASLEGKGMIKIRNVSFEKNNNNVAGYTGSLYVLNFINEDERLFITGKIFVHDTLDLISGEMTIFNGGILTMQENSVIHLCDGSLRNDSGVFNTAAPYNVIYTGGSRMSGSELRSRNLKDLTVQLNSDNAVLSLINDLHVNGTFNLKNGKFDLNGKDIMLNGKFMQASNTFFIGDVESNMIIGLKECSEDPVVFDESNKQLKNLVVNMPANGVVALTSNLQLAGNLEIIEGNLDIAGHELTVRSSANIINYAYRPSLIISGNGALKAGKSRPQSADLYVDSDDSR